MSARTEISVTPVTGASPVPLDLRDLTVVDHACHHVVAKGHSVATKTKSFDEGDPVVLTWGLVGHLYRTVMYVHRVEDPPDTSDARHLTLTLVGASWPLKSAEYRVFTNTSAAQVLAEIATAHGMSYSFDATNRTFDTFVSKGSDWETLRDLAHRVGGTLRADSTTLRIFDVDYGLRDADTAPVLSPLNSPQAKITYKASRADRRARRVAVVNPFTKEIASVSDDLSFDTDDLVLTERAPVAAGSIDEVEQDLRAKRAVERHRERGEIRPLPGEPRLRPGTVVGITGFTPAKRGLWTVTKATHSLSQSNFTTALEIGRGPLHPRAVAPASRAVTAPIRGDGGTPVLKRDRWVSA